MNQFYNIRAAATEGAPNEVFIYDEIGFWGTTAQTFHNAIQALSGKIVVRINSPGGNVFDAIAIHSMLSRLPDVETITDGLAASAASVIFAAGKARKMAKAAFVMIHNPWTYAQGSADDMRKEADILEGITNALVKLYKGSSSKSEEELREMMETPRLPLVSPPRFSRLQSSKPPFQRGATSVPRQLSRPFRPTINQGPT